MIWSEKHKEGAAQAIVNSRELCGDEMEAVRQYADDNDLRFPTVQLGAIRYMADLLWQEYRRQAGVKC